ncbi:MAG: preprotein translocase subunit SecY [Cyclobacteriaceae bacterium]
MMKIISTIKDIFSIEELRTRIVNTLFFICIFRLGSFILLPGLDFGAIQAAVPDQSGNNILDLLNTFVGGAFYNKAIFSLGIMPYITASIVIQLLTVAVPHFQKLQKEGESGRRIINKYTKLLTIAVCLVQSRGFLLTIQDDWILGGNKAFFIFTSMVVLTGGSMFCVWLGDKITEKGIGNGVSLLIMVGIVSRFIPALVREVSTKGFDNLLFLLIEFTALFFIILLTVMITQGVRRIPINYAKQLVGNGTYGGGQRQYIPLKIIAAGVMPIIFAQSIMFLPALLAGVWRENSETANYIVTTFSDRYSFPYNALFVTMIILFTYFYTAITTNPNQISDDLKRNNGFIPGVKPGPQTGEFIDTIMSRLLFPGSLLIAAIAVIHVFAYKAGVQQEFSLFYGGTSLLIVVGVVLDTLQQIESYLLMQRYEGMMKSGNVKGRQSQPIRV